MNVDKEFEKLGNSLQKSTDKLLNCDSYKDYELLNHVFLLNQSKKYKGGYYILLGDSVHKKYMRDTVKNTLLSMKYKRGNSWSEPEAVAFIDCVMYCDEDRKAVQKQLGFVPIDSEEFPLLFNQSISKIFNVPINRFSNQVLLLLSLDKKYHKYKFDKWFTPYEIIKWKYNNSEKFHKEVENGTASSEDLQLIKELFDI